ncbi:MAG: hypothetical protein SGBAC_005839 [Bacillariaceae sp.]
MMSTKQAARGIDDKASDAISLVRDGSVTGEFIIIDEIEFQQQETPLRRTAKKIFNIAQSEDDDAAIWDWPLAFMPCGDGNADESDQCSVHEVAVLEDPGINRLRQKIQEEEQKHKSVVEVRSLKIGHQGRNLVVSDPNNMIFGRSRAIPIQDVTDNLLETAANATAAAPVSTTDPSVRGITRYASQDIEVVKSKLPGNYNDNDPSPRYYEDNEEDVCG